MAKAEPRPMEDPESARERAVRSAAITRAVVVDRGAIAQLPRVLDEIGHASACRIVADMNTMAAAGDRAAAALTSAGIAIEEPIVLSESPRLKPRVETAREVARHLATTGALPIAVGSGVINDLTKYAAELTQLPYISVATAASMDGYAASGAALLDGGFKRTLACKAPVAIVADLDVIAKAPPRMAAWGYGDLAGKVVAGADWILADALGEETLAPAPFALVHDHLSGWLSAPEGVAAHDIDALRGLVDGLLISGFAMQAHHNSRPASGSEHQLAHVWEMERLSVNGEPVAHGACVGVGTVAMLALYEWLLAQDVRAAADTSDIAQTEDESTIEAELASSFPEPALAQSARTEMVAKRARTVHRAARIRLLVGTWPALRPRIADSIVSAATMQQWLRRCGAASQPADIGLSPQKLAGDIRRARLIRRRYTILDCLEDLGLLERAIAAVCGDERTAVAPSSPSA